jgi:TPR repeat protein
MDLTERAHLYKLVADQRNPDAQMNYGIFLAHGRGVSMDLQKAAYYFKLAVDQGSVYAQINYGVCTETGRGISMVF